MAGQVALLLWLVARQMALLNQPPIVDFLEKKRVQILLLSPTDVVLHIRQSEQLPATLEEQLPMMEKFFMYLRRMFFFAFSFVMIARGGI